MVAVDGLLRNHHAADSPVFSDKDQQCLLPGTIASVISLVTSYKCHVFMIYRYTNTRKSYNKNNDNW